ncbi:unnamed protein product, partial [Sphenostylis stenocarpa]
NPERRLGHLERRLGAPRNPECRLESPERRPSVQQNPTAVSTSQTAVSLRKQTQTAVSPVQTAVPKLVFWLYKGGAPRGFLTTLLASRTPISLISCLLNTSWP